MLDIRIAPRSARNRAARPQPPRRVEGWSARDIIAAAAPEEVRSPRREGPMVNKRSIDPVARSRFQLEPLSGRVAKMPPFDADYILEGRTRYPSSRSDPAAERVLKSGEHQSKIGSTIVKGRWRGMPIYALTLEERATCPSDCALYRSCYGNMMNWSRRFEHGPALEAALVTEIGDLAIAHPRGFAVRLHVLGDFYSVDYVALWRRLLEATPELHVFGFSARWRREDDIGQALLKLAYENWDRFAIRFSNAPIETCSTVTIEYAGAAPADAIVCPQQLGKTKNCASCGLCWQTERRIAFIRH